MLDIMKLDEVILMSFKEDMPFGDITTDNIIFEDSQSTANLIAKESGVIAGIPVVKRTFEILDSKAKMGVFFNDGSRVEKGDIIATITGKTAALLKGERTALNLLQRLSGVATRTSSMCKLIEGYKAKIVDTRKTTPGLRYLEKYAVRTGGGHNHRFSLSDGVLIKDNHIMAAGGIKEAISLVRGKIPHTIKIEVEVENVQMVQDAIDAKADIIMLDNMNEEMMTQAVKLIDGRALVEASGDIDENTIINVAKTGVDIISIGRITHSIKALDISLRIIKS